MPTTMRNNDDDLKENGDSLFACLKAHAERKTSMIGRTDKRCKREQQRRERLERLQQDCFSGSVSSLEVDLTDNDTSSESDDIAVSRFSASPTTSNRTGRFDSIPELPSSSDRPVSSHQRLHKNRRAWDRRSWHSERGGLGLEADLDAGLTSREARWSSESSGGSPRGDDLSATLGKVGLHHRFARMERNLIPPKPADQDFKPSSLPRSWPTISNTDRRWHGDELSSTDKLLTPLRR
jgi:hypothetical protein